MTQPIIRTITIEQPHGVSVRTRGLATVTRTAGLAGDLLAFQVSAAKWDAAPILPNLPFRLTVRDSLTPLLELDWYFLRQVDPAVIAQTIGDEPEDDPAARLYSVQMLTLPGVYRDGRGGVLTEGVGRVINPVGPGGVVPGAADLPERMENADLIRLCLDALPFDYDITPEQETALNSVAPPGPLDLLGQSALHTLEQLLGRIGWECRLRNAGATLGIDLFRLPRGGEAITLPAVFTEAELEGEMLTSAPANAADRVIITSGATRSAVVTWATLETAPAIGGPMLEYVYLDDRTGRWLNQAEHAQLYPTETGPADIGAFIAGPPADPAERLQFNRLYRAVRLVRDHPARDTAPGPGALGEARLVAPAEAVDVDGGSFTLGAGISAAGFAASADLIAPGQFAGRGDTPRFIEGVRAINGAGVFVFPAPLVRIIGDDPHGGYADCRALSQAELLVAFGHESVSGQSSQDFFIRGYRATADQGVLNIAELPDPPTGAQVGAPPPVTLEAPYLRRVLLGHGPMDGPEAAGGMAPTPVNDDLLAPVALELATMNLSGELAESGVLIAAGLLAIEPGDGAGAIGSVTWDLDGFTTAISVNAHEAPGSRIEQLKREAGRSFAGGVGRFDLPGGAVAAASLQAAGGTAGTGAESVFSGGGLVGRGGSGARPAPAPTHAVRPARQERLLAKITGATEVAPDRYEYDWAEVVAGSAKGAFTLSTTVTSATHGPAYSGAEAFHGESSLLGSGVDSDNFSGQGTWGAAPVGPRIVELLGPFADASGEPWWLTLSASTHEDGSCPESVALVGYSAGSGTPAASSSGCGCGGAS